MNIIKLSPAQVSAMECRDWTENPEVTDAWNGQDEIRVTEENKDDLWRAINDASNAEDGWWEEKRDNFARVASLSLTIVATKVLMA